MLVVRRRDSARFISLNPSGGVCTLFSHVDVVELLLAPLGGLFYFWLLYKLYADYQLSTA